MRALLVPGGDRIHALAGLADEQTVCGRSALEGYVLIEFWMAIPPEDRCLRCVKELYVK